MRARLRAAGIDGVACPGEGSVAIELATPNDEARVLNLLALPHRFEVRAVLGVLTPQDATYPSECRFAENFDGEAAACVVNPDIWYAAASSRFRFDQSVQRLALSSTVIGHRDVASAQAEAGELNWGVRVQFRSDGGEQWRRSTADAACREPGDPRGQVALVVDGLVWSTYAMGADVRCSVGIEGSELVLSRSDPPMSSDEARDLAVALATGPLSVRFIPS